MGQRIPKNIPKKHLHFLSEQALAQEEKKAPTPKVQSPRKKKAVLPAEPLEAKNGFEVIESWLAGKDQTAFPFQEETWHAYGAGQSGLVNAPTGFGKTFAVFLAVIIEWISQNPDYQYKEDNGLQLLWVSPLRALSADIARAMQAALEELKIPWQVGIRNGDTSTTERARQKRALPEILVITPESLHLLCAGKGYKPTFQTLRCICVDEWHELLGTKRGVQVELALAHLSQTGPSPALPKGEGGPSLGNPDNVASADIKVSDGAAPSPLGRAGEGPRIWGLSATIGNLEEAVEVLCATVPADTVLIRSGLHKQIEMQTLLPETIDRLPWAGQLGLRMIEDVIPVIRRSQSTLLFCNTRAQSERWYQGILDAAPDLAGQLALHHSAIDPGLRSWVEGSLHAGTLKCVVCTASLDLGVDFRPVDTIIQIGSPKGIARFLQRAGRSGHQPGEISRVFFVPTHSLEIVESAALQQAYENGVVERRQPMQLSFDVLVQWAVTLAVGEGFSPNTLYKEVIQTYNFRQLSPAEWDWILHFITKGGDSLNGYDEYHRVQIGEDGIYRVNDKRTALRHRMNMGTIVSDAMVRVKFLSGGFVGAIEESFISRLKPGDTFLLAGRKLELVLVRDMEAKVRNSKAKNAIVPSWAGNRLSMSADFGAVLRSVFEEVAVQRAPPQPSPKGRVRSPQVPKPGTPSPLGRVGEGLLESLAPLFDLQSRRSAIPAAGQLLAEIIRTRDGYHLFMYPFEGRGVNAALAGLLAYRLSVEKPVTFSIAANDYGFELLSEDPIEMDSVRLKNLLRTEDLYEDLSKSVNAQELARRKFRDIAVIGGLVFSGMPGSRKGARHLQSSSGLVYDVIAEAEPNNLLLQQAYSEALAQEMEWERLWSALQRILAGEIIVTTPSQLTPFSFPIKVDSLRETLSSEKLEDRIKRMQAAAVRWD